MSRPREFLKEFSNSEKKAIFNAAFDAIHDWIIQSPSAAAEYILDHFESDTESLFNWINIDENLEDEDVRDTLGFWPWKNDPIPASELGLKND